MVVITMGIFGPSATQLSYDRGYARGKSNVSSVIRGGYDRSDMYTNFFAGIHADVPPGPITFQSRVQVAHTGAEYIEYVAIAGGIRGQVFTIESVMREYVRKRPVDIPTDRPAHLRGIADGLAWFRQQRLAQRAIEAEARRTTEEIARRQEAAAQNPWRDI